MTLNITTDYAVRIMLYLATNLPERNNISGKEIAETIKIPYNYFLKIVPHLKDANFIISHQGKKGGYSLIKSPDNITMHDIIHAMNDNLIINQCLTSPDNCSRNAVGHCPVHSFWSDLQKEIDGRLKTVTLAEMAQKNREMT